MSFDLHEMWASMGLIAKAVVFTLLIMSIYSVGCGVERLFVYGKAKSQSKVLLGLISKLLRDNKVDECIKLASDKRFKSSHLAKVLSAGLTELQFQSDSHAPYSEQVESAKRAIEVATIKGVQEFKRGLGFMATIGSTGPFVGLFGTVFGIINAFQSMSVSGSGGIGTVAAGISEALMTTGFGIIVAVVAVMFFNTLLAKVEVFTGEMANASSTLLDHFIKLKYKKGA
jgi:biopolymer transport protein ExbB/biopolymer transport protein TolQ